MSDDKNICKDCGKNHEDFFFEHIREFALLDKARGASLGDNAADLAPESVVQFTQGVVQENEGLFRQMVEDYGPIKAIQKFSQILMEHGFVIGVAVANSMPHDIPVVNITDDEVEEYEKGVREAIKVMDAALTEEQIAQMIEALKKQGALPPDFNGQLVFAGPNKDIPVVAGDSNNGSEEDESASNTVVPFPGNYL